MIQATQLKRGMCIKHENELYRIVEAQHKTPGNLRGLVQTKIRNLRTGAISEHRFRSVDMVERAILDEAEMEYLYQDGDNYIFMNPTSFEQVNIPADMLGDSAPFLQEGMECQVALFNEVPISVEIPQRVTLEITDTEPAIKNQTASSSFKPAVLSNGVRTMVPPHVTSGTRIVVDTSDGSYIERAKD